jgi:hypothetical protein
MNTSEAEDSMLDCSAGAPPAVAGASRPRFGSVTIRNRGRLPHWEFPGYNLSEAPHSWKSFTAKSANRILGLSGSPWQREYYDHLIQDEAELRRAIRYMGQNPEKANLKPWKWVWGWGQDAPTTAAGTAALRRP